MHRWDDFIYLIFTRIRRIMTTEDGSSWRMTSAHATPLPTQRSRRNLWVIIEGSYVRLSVFNYCFDFMSKFRPFGVVLNPLFRILFSLWGQVFFPSNFRLTLQKFQIKRFFFFFFFFFFIVLFICTVSKSPFLIGRIICSPTWFGLFDEQYSWLIIRCELRPELRQKRSWQYEARRINILYCVCEANVRPVKNRLKNCVRRHRVNYWFGHNMFVR